MLTTSHPPIMHVIRQHAEESAVLCNIRSAMVSGPHIKMNHLRRLDDRLTAHLDGIAVTGKLGWKMCEEGLGNPGVGEIFAASVRAIEDKNLPALEKLLALVEEVSELHSGLISAFGWVPMQFLQGVTPGLINSTSAFRRQIGIAACGTHRVEPGEALDAAVTDPDAPLRARSLRVAGECGRRDLLSACVAVLADDDTNCRFWAAYSAVLLGERDKGINALKVITLQAGPFRERALQLVLKVLNVSQANELLKLLAKNLTDIRHFIQGVGIAGNPAHVPQLITHMADLNLARLAGESFSFITGLDLAYLDLDRKPPQDFEPGPNDNPDDPDVSMDIDDNLPWPDPVKVQAWWSANSHRISPGKRYFMGEEPTWEHCLKVLKEGYQRQRIAAAQWRCLLRPGTILFNTAAPAWRQKSELDRMT